METKLADLLTPKTVVGTLELEVTDTGFDSATKKLKGAHSEFGELRQSLLGKRATVAIASPDPNKVLLTTEGDRERVLVPLICTFDPDPGAHFNYARIDGLLVTAPHWDPAVAIEMFPKEINSQVQVSSEFKFSPKFSFNDVEVEPLEVSKKKDYIQFDPEILALYIGTPRPSWSLKSTDARNVAGVKYLFLIVDKPAGEVVQMEINVGGRVQTNLGPIPVARVTKDRVAKLTIDI
jgi:hypothetical protein